MVSEFILSGITFSNIQFCSTNVIDSYLQYYGYNLFSDFLGRYWNFVFTCPEQKFYLSSVEPDFHISPMTVSYVKLLQQKYGIKIKHLVVSKDKDQLVQLCCDMLRRKYPLIVSIDPYVLKHYDTYMKCHGLNWNHYIIIIGYSQLDHSFIYLDSTRVFISGSIHRISFDLFYDSCWKFPNIFRCPPEIVVIEKPNVDLNSLPMKIANEQSEKKARLQEFTGTTGLKMFSHKLRELSCIDAKDQQKMYLDYILNRIVLISQHRKANVQFCSEYLNYTNENLFRIAKLWEVIKFSLSPVRKKSYSQKMMDIAGYVNTIALLEEEIFNDFRKRGLLL